MKTDRSIQIGWQLAICFDKYRANCNSQLPGAGMLPASECLEANSRTSTSKVIARQATIVLHWK
jgi:hypothetical protein